MARVFIGRKTSGGGGALKVMKNNADDPNTTPSTAVDKFLFDSEVQDIGYAVQTYTIGGNAVGLYPPGSSRNTCIAEITDEWVYSGWYTFFYPKTFVPGSGYIQYTDAQCKSIDTGRWTLGGWYGDFNGNRNYGKYGYGNWGTILKSGNGLPLWDTLTRDVFYIYQMPDGGGALDFKYQRQADYKFLVWSMPADATDFSPPSAPPVAGQKNVELTPSSVKISRPGFDTTTAVGRQLIADSNNIPAKVLRCGSIASIPSGSYADVPIGFVIPDDGFVDGQFSDATISDFILPGFSDRSGSWDQRIIRIEYELVAGNTTVRFYNRSSFPVKGRYIVFGSGDGPSTGDCPVLRRVAGSPDYVQLVRPGAGDPPHWDDIIVDTRASYLPLIATGYVPRSSFLSVSSPYGQRAYSLTVDCPAGYVPYVKATILGGAYGISWPQYERVWNGSGGGSALGLSFMIGISGSVVTFFGMDTYQTAFNTSDNTDSAPWDGWAYWIFAVPDAL